MVNRSSFDDFHMVSVIVWGMFFALVYSALSVWTIPGQGERIFNSPDETANYYFTRVFSDRNSLHVAEPLNAQYYSTIHPRAVGVSSDSELIPGSFVGMMVLYGFIAKIFGDWIIVFLTPIISIWGAVYFYKFLKNIFSPVIAFASCLLLFLLPPWWYYNMRSMFHNVLFINLVIWFLYNSVVCIKEKKQSNGIAAACFLGLAIAVRTSEAVWMVPLFFIFLLMTLKHSPKKHSFYAFSVFVLFMLGLAFLQSRVFGNFLTGAYNLETYGREAWRTVYNVIFPFGAHPLSALKRFYDYYVVMFWWYAIPSIAGWFYTLYGILKKNISREELWYWVLVSFLSLFLVVYYGSWRVVDNLDPDKITLGTSYARYWLPIYIFSLPFVSQFFLKLYGAMQHIFGKTVFVFALAVLFIFFSLRITWFWSEESILSVKNEILGYYLKRQRVLQEVPPDAIIVTDRSDKIFFPTMKVMVNIADPKIQQAMAKLLRDNYGLYFYSHLQLHDIVTIQEFLKQEGVYFSDRIKIYENEYLYPMDIFPL